MLLQRTEVQYITYGSPYEYASPNQRYLINYVCTKMELTKRNVQKVKMGGKRVANFVILCKVHTCTLHMIYMRGWRGGSD